MSQTPYPISTSDSHDGVFKAVGPDPVTSPEFYDSIMMKRAVAYLIDVCICFFLGAIAWFVAFMVGIMSFGLLMAPLMALTGLVPLLYHVLLVGSSESSTLGMRMMGVRVFRLDGGNPSYVQAFIQIAIFYLTIMPTSFLILLVCFFNPQRRCLHDYLAGTLTLNKVSKTVG